MNPLFMNLPGNNLILIADDNPFNRNFLSEVLKKQNFSVIKVTNGEEAVNSVKENSFRIILMDILMPGISGLEATRQIRAMGVLTPIIAISAMSFKQDQEKALEAGCNAFLPKPVGVKDLNVLLEKYVLQIIDPKIIMENKITSQEKYQNKKQKALFSKYKLLLVEEEENIANEYKCILKELGFNNVTVVSNGVLALEILKNNSLQLDIVISNIFTSEIDAMGLLSIIKKEYTNIFMFIYARQYDVDTFQFAMTQGVDGIVTQDNFKNSIPIIIETTIYQFLQNGSQYDNATTAKQVKKAQEQLIKIGCDEPCKFLDIGLIPLHEAGGDMAKCVKLNSSEKCAIVLGDVAGHDVTSSYMSAMFMGLISSMDYENAKPVNFMNELNIKLCKMGYETTHICATIIILNRRTRNIIIVTAGNPGGLLVNIDLHGNFSFQELLGGGLCMGMLDEHDLFVSEKKTLEKGSWLFHFSDGIEKKYIQEVLIKNPDILKKESANEVSISIIDKIVENHGQEDDMILLTTYTPSDLLRDNDTLIHENYFKIKSNYVDVDVACRWFNDKLPIEKIPIGKDRDFLLLALRETLLNSVEHGNKRNPEASINMFIYFESDCLKVSISDEGFGFDLSDTLKKLKSYDGFQIGKRGLAIVESVADSIQVDGGTVSLIFRAKGNH